MFGVLSPEVRPSRRLVPAGSQDQRTGKREGGGACRGTRAMPEANKIFGYQALALAPDWRPP